MTKAFTRVFLFFLFIPLLSNAGVFNLPSFIEEGHWSFGLEPEVVISRPTGVGINFKPRYGVNDFLNWQGIFGTGTGYYKFRTGITADFEWFPDNEDQPGIATPVTLLYYRVEEAKLLNLFAQPMVYKTFNGEAGAYTPFVAFPLGWKFMDAKAEYFIHIALGTVFHHPDTPHWQFTLEAAFNIQNSFSSISGGITYNP